MNRFYSTRQVAGFLDIKPGTLQKAIWQGRVIPPSKGPSGQYLWTIPDIESASWALRCYESFAQWESKLDSQDALAAKPQRQTIIRGER